MTFEYNEVGDVKRRVDYMGRETKYTSDNLNRLTEIEYLPTTAFGTTFYTPNQKSIYGFDDISRLTSATNEMGTVSFGYDNRNRATSTTDVFGRTINYEYELTPTVNQKRLKFDGAMYAAYNFDDAGRLSNIVNSADSTTISFGYDNEDKIVSRTYPNGVSTGYQYFDNDLLKRITDSNTSTTLFDRQYLYNAARQISQIIEPNRSRTFGYDNADRLTSVTDATHGNETYAFDDVGNRTSSHRSATYGYQAGQFNRLTSTATATYQFDANGNTTTKSEGSNLWRYTWDYENRLGEAATRRQKVRYKFDALGRRVQRYIVGGKENTKFIHDGDDLGSTTGLADSIGALSASTAYDSFGNATNSSFPSRYQFTGRELDSLSGLHYYRARFYDSNLGRFTSVDPIGFAGGDVNLYGYVWNNPLHYVDPMGLDGFGNDFADWADRKTEYARKWWQGKPENWVRNGSVNTVADLASGFNNMFRVGTGLGQAMYCENLSDIERLDLVSADIIRGGSLVLTMAGPFAGRLGTPRSPKSSPNPAAEWLGADARPVITNAAGDKVVLSADGTRRIRFDFSRPHPHKNPHMHVEEFVNGRWIKSGPIYPQGVPNY